jgi:hypothetical protein
MKDIIAVVAATAETRGIGYKGQLVSSIIIRSQIYGRTTTW